MKFTEHVLIETSFFLSPFWLLLHDPYLRQNVARACNFASLQHNLWYVESTVGSVIHTQRDEVVVRCWLPAADDCTQVISRRHPWKRRKSPDKNWFYDKRGWIWQKKKSKWEHWTWTHLEDNLMSYHPLMRRCLTLSSCRWEFTEKVFYMQGNDEGVSTADEIISAQNAKWPVQMQHLCSRE